MRKKTFLIFLLILFLILGIYGENISANEKIEELTDDLMSYDWQVRRDAVLDLSRMGDKAKEALPYLILATGDSNFIIAIQSRNLINSLGIEEEKKIEIIKEHLQDPEDKRVFLWAAKALVNLDPARDKVEDIIPVLSLAIIGETDKEILKSARETLSEIGDEKDAIPYLKEALSNTDIEQQIKGAAGLIRLEYETDKIIEVVVEALNSDKISVIKNALVAVEEMSQGQKEQVYKEVSASKIEYLENKIREERYELVRKFDPVGYWPADEGEGDKIYDRSENGSNDGLIYHIDWKGGFLDFRSYFQFVEIPTHSGYQVNEFTIGGWLYSRRQDYDREGMFFFGGAKKIQSPHHIWRMQSPNLRIRTDGEIEVFSAGESDAISSIAEGISIRTDTWQHILYSYKDGTGNLYLNGELVKSEDNVPFSGWEYRFLIGNDAAWWHYLSGTRSLDGSVRDMVIFDRVLSSETVYEIYSTTRPDTNPPEPEAEEIEAPEKKMTVGELIETIQDKDSPREKKINSVLEIKERRRNVQQEAVPVFVEVLEEILEEEGIYVPGVEDRLRNALILALLQIAPEDEDVKKVLSSALAKPILDLVDLSESGLAEVKELVADDYYMEALDVYRNLPSGDRNTTFFTQGDIHRDERQHAHNPRAYTPKVTHNGITYQIGNGLGPSVTTRIAEDDYKEIVAELAEEYPAAKDWRASDYPELYRVVITKIDEEGNRESVFLEGEWFVLDGRDGKSKGWSIAVDQEGYLHLIGGQHNVPNPNNYIPGSWEKMGLVRNRHSQQGPRQMYWVSEEPGDIESFEFVGQNNNPRHLPPVNYNYMNYVTDNDGQLFTYGRISVHGFWSWGFYRYNKETRRWETIGGDAFDIIESSDEEFPGWSDYLIRQVLGRLPTSPGGTESFIWSWAPHFYNYCRAQWGVYFDKTNRMHVFKPHRGIGEKAQIIDDDIYAYSDDGGETFYRVDGKRLELPLTVNPSPDHNAQVSRHSTEQWWDLWTSLIDYAGYDVIYD